MIDNIHDLCDVINAVANRALDIVAEKSMSGQYFVDHSDVADLISKEDFLKYADLIVNELSIRPELLEPVVLDDGQLDINMGLAYCKGYQWCDGDEEIFDCSYEEWLEKEAEPVSHPLSLSRMAEIGYAAVSYIDETQVSSVKDLTDSVGLTAVELKELTGEDITPDNPEAEQNVAKLSLDHLIEAARNQADGFGKEDDRPPER